MTPGYLYSSHSLIYCIFCLVSGIRNSSTLSCFSLLPYNIFSENRGDFPPQKKGHRGSATVSISSSLIRPHYFDPLNEKEEYIELKQKWTKVDHTLVHFNIGSADEFLIFQSGYSTAFFCPFILPSDNKTPIAKQGVSMTQ